MGAVVVVVHDTIGYMSGKTSAYSSFKSFQETDDPGCL